MRLALRRTPLTKAPQEIEADHYTAAPKHYGSETFRLVHLIAASSD
jgi:hypothetical protein